MLTRPSPPVELSGQGPLPVVGKPGGQTASSQRDFAPRQTRSPRPRYPCPHESQPDLPPRGKPGASPRHGFSRARERPRQTRRIPCQMLRRSQAPRRRRFPQPSLHLDFQHMAHGHDARDLHGNGDAQKRHPREAREEGTEKIFAHQREQRDKDNRHHADDAGR